MACTSAHGWRGRFGICWPNPRAEWELDAEPAAVAAAVRAADDDRLWAVHDSLRHLLFHYIREEAGTAGATNGRMRRNWPRPARSCPRRPHGRFRPAVRDLQARRPAPPRSGTAAASIDRPAPSRPDHFSGKAHPADDPGKRVLQQVFLAAQDPSFEAGSLSWRITSSTWRTA